MKNNVDQLRSAAINEVDLMNFYNVRLPAVSNKAQQAHYSVCQVSVSLLRDRSSWLLTRHVPVEVYGDGNCLFRAVSTLLFGSEQFHAHLRLLYVAEVVGNRAFYDKSSPGFYAPFAADHMLVLCDFENFVADLCTLGSYSGFQSTLATTELTVWPIPVNPGQHPPYSKLVAERGVTSCEHPLFVLWTTCRYDGCLPVDVNYIVPLCECNVQTCVAPTVSADVDMLTHIGHAVGDTPVVVLETKADQCVRSPAPESQPDE